MKLRTKRPPFGDTRTPGTPDRCEFSCCRAPGAGELRGHLGMRPGRPPWTMCRGHLNPEVHPKDLRDKLFTWPTASC